MEMKVSVKKLTGAEGATKAYATIAFDGEFAVTGIKVMEGKKGLFVSMPNRKDKDGNYKDIAFPITKEAREKVIKAVLDAYESDTTAELPVSDDFIEAMDDEVPFK